MTPRQSFLEVLDGADRVAFLPLVWDRLPEFLQSAATASWSLDAATVVRFLTESAELCKGHAVEVPVVVESIAGDELSSPRLDAVSQLAAMGRFGTVVSVPTIGALLASRPDSDPWALEDDVRELVRAAFERGADAVLIRGSDPEDMRSAASALGGIVRYFGRSMMWALRDEGECFGGKARLASVAPMGAWPNLASGIIVTDGDLSLTSPAEVRDWLNDRPGDLADRWAS